VYTVLRTIKSLLIVAPSKFGKKFSEWETSETILDILAPFKKDFLALFAENQDGEKNQADEENQDGTLILVSQVFLESALKSRSTFDLPRLCLAVRMLLAQIVNLLVAPPDSASKTPANYFYNHRGVPVAMRPAERRSAWTDSQEEVLCREAGQIISGSGLFTKIKQKYPVLFRNKNPCQLRVSSGPFSLSVCGCVD
jgi:hypothetical protein